MKLPTVASLARLLVVVCCLFTGMAWGCDLSYDYVKINAGELDARLQYIWRCGHYSHHIKLSACCKTYMPPASPSACCVLSSVFGEHSPVEHSLIGQYQTFGI
jgi:hypothetical protein